MLLRLRAAFRKELAQFCRAKALVVLVIYMFAEIANCAWALSMDVRNLPLLVVDLDASSASRALTERFRIAPYFVYRSADRQIDPVAVLQDGSAALVLTVPAGFGRALDRGEPASVQLLIDGSYSNISLLALSYAGDIVERYNATVRSEVAFRNGQPPELLPAVVHRVRLWYMPGLEYAHFQMVSMLGISALVLGVLLPAAAIVREKEAGTLEQLLVTPLRPWELVAAKLVPMGLLMAVGVGLGLLEARLLFDVPVRGSLWLFFAFSLLLLFSSMGLGAYVGAVTHNLLQTLLLTFALLFPMFFLSGSIMPVENMPEVLQWLTYVSPLRHYLPLAQGILFKGVGLETLGPSAAALGAYGLLVMMLGVRQLRRTLLN
ncbi:MAG: ABC transporter permease [Chloroflexi bacterium]|nr:ABC transporter permease [Chloroflexota bacterium]